MASKALHVNGASAAIIGISGKRLNAEEKEFFSDIRPFGYILFTRNCENASQVRGLIEELRGLHGNAVLPILIDQEGGRVARLKPPHWRASPPAGTLASLASRSLEKARYAIGLNARLIAQELHALGITVDCAPVADILVPGAHDIVGNRAYGSNPQHVSILARAMAEGLLEGGVLPVVKHIPGHGRAQADSHEALPVVDTSLDELKRTDFVPFRALNDMPFAMTAHVLYTAIDAHRLATVSPVAVQLIREAIGFDGCLMSDDLSMHAMSGDFGERTQRTLEAGCDVVLHCNGNMQEMQAIAAKLKPLQGESLRRAERAMQRLHAPQPFDMAAAEAELEGMLA